MIYQCKNNWNMDISDAKTVKCGDHLLYEAENDNGNTVWLDCVVKGVWGDPNKFACDMVDPENECGITNAFAPIACFRKI